jgi:hypothetical protein
MNIVFLLQLDVNVEPPQGGQRQQACQNSTNPASLVSVLTNVGEPAATARHSQRSAVGSPDTVAPDHHSSSSGAFSRTVARLGPPPSGGRSPDSSPGTRAVWRPLNLHLAASGKVWRVLPTSRLSDPGRMRNIRCGLLQPPLHTSCRSNAPTSSCAGSLTAQSQRRRKRAGRCSRRP